VQVYEAFFTFASHIKTLKNGRSYKYLHNQRLVALFDLFGSNDHPLCRCRRVVLAGTAFCTDLFCTGY
jgi:hypothetical protein